MSQPNQVKPAVSKATVVQNNRKRKTRRKRKVPREVEIQQLKTALEGLRKKYAEANDGDCNIYDKQSEIKYEKFVEIREKQDQCERRLRYLQNEVGDEPTDVFVNCTGFEPLNEKLSEFLNDRDNLKRPLTKKIFSRILNEVKEVHGEELMIRNRIPVNRPEDLLIFSMIQIQNIVRQTKLLRVHVPMWKRYDPEGSYDEFISDAVGSISKENENGEEVRDSLKLAAEVVEEEGDICSLDEEEEDLVADENSENGDLEEFLTKVVGESEDNNDELILRDSDDEEDEDDESNVADDNNDDSTLCITLDSNDGQTFDEGPTSNHGNVDTVVNGENTLNPFNQGTSRKRPAFVITENVKRPQMASSVYPQKGTVMQFKEGGRLSLSPSNFIHNSHVGFDKIQCCSASRPHGVPVITLSDDDDA